MSESILKLNNVTTGYRKNIVANDISFEITEGEVFGLIGLNGVGKTTLIKTILGLRDPIAGSIEHKGKKNLSFLPERFDPPWFLSGFQFLQFSQKLYGVQISLDEAREATKLISLDPDSLQKDVKTYSKGMRQKLGLLATMLTNCKLLLLDEPMSGLDPKARAEVKSLILQAKKKQQAVLMCTHILSDVAELCDRVAILHEEKILFIGAPDDLIQRHQSETLERAFLKVIGYD